MGSGGYPHTKITKKIRSRASLEMHTNQQMQLRIQKTPILLLIPLFVQELHGKFAPQQSYKKTITSWMVASACSLFYFIFDFWSIFKN
jgi:hypothetical protein